MCANLWGMYLQYSKQAVIVTGNQALQVAPSGIALTEGAPSLRTRLSVYPESLVSGNQLSPMQGQRRHINWPRHIILTKPNVHLFAHYSSVALRASPFCAIPHRSALLLSIPSFSSHSRYSHYTPWHNGEEVRLQTRQTDRQAFLCLYIRRHIGGRKLRPCRESPRKDRQRNIQNLSTTKI